MKKNNKIEEVKRLEILKSIIWFNLFIGIYNLYVFNEISSLFHLVLGSMNIGVWVFYRGKYLNISFSKIFSSTKKHSNSI